MLFILLLALAANLSSAPFVFYLVDACMRNTDILRWGVKTLARGISKKTYYIRTNETDSSEALPSS